MPHIPEHRKHVRRKDENALYKSEEKYRNILENIEEGYYELDLAGNFTFFNDSMLRIMGYPREELMGMNNRVYTNKETAKKLFQAFNEVYRTGKPGRIVDYEIVRKDGTKGYIEISISLHKDSSGKPIGFRGVVRDITERKRAEEELRQGEERYRNILESIQEGYFEVDLAGNFTFVNDAQCKNTGTPREQLIGKNNRNYTSEEEAKRLYQIYSRIYRTGEPVKGYAFEFTRRDGAKAFHEVSVSLMRDAEGKPIGFRGLARDVTERKKMEETLRKSEEKYRTILEDMEEGYFEINLAGDFTFVNDAECKNMGYSREELIGMNNRQYADKENAKKVFLAFSNLYKTGEPCKIFDYEVTKKDGTKEVSELLVSLIKDSKGKPIGFRGLSRHITERKHMEDELRRSEEKFRTIIETIQDGYFETDLAGRYIFANEALRRRQGYPKEELIGMSNRQFQNETNAKKAYQAFNEVYRTGEPIKALEMEVIKKDGTRGISELSVSLIRDAQGKPIGFRGISHDVTERKRAEEVLRQSEEKYRLVVENAKEGIIIAQDLKMVFANRAAMDMTGYSGEILVKPFTDFIHPDDRNLVVDHHIRRLKGEEVPLAYSFRLISQDGTVKWVEFNTTVIQWKEKPATLSFLNDITERKQAEDKLRQSEEKYRTILEEMEEGYFELDLAGNFTFVNDAACKNSGYSKEEMIGMNNRRYQNEETAKKMYHSFTELYKKGEPIKLSDVEIIKKDWTIAFQEVSISLIKDTEGKPIGFRGVSRDITKRKHAEDALERNREDLIIKNKEIEESRNNLQNTLEKLEKAYEEQQASQLKILQQEKMASIGQLAAGVAHEINNPMAFVASNLGTLDKYIHRFMEFIQLQSEVIESFKVDDAIKGLKKKRKELKLDYITGDVSHLIKESLEGSERVQNIVQGLNRFSRLDQAEYKTVDINACIEDSITIAWNELKHKVTLKKDYGNLLPTKCFPQQMNQVFINLLINAGQAIERKGKIKIKTWEKDKSIWVTISDTGCGIPRENFTKVFEPFFTSKDAGKGTGLGLSITYEIIQRHKGEITFESEEGKGTTFTIRIPIV